MKGVLDNIIGTLPGDFLLHGFPLSLPPKHPCNKNLNLALFLAHSNLESLPRQGVDGGKESWFRVDVLFLCNLSLRYTKGDF